MSLFTILIYLNFVKRSVVTPGASIIDLWTFFYSTVSYLGVMFNVILILQIKNVSFENYAVFEFFGIFNQKLKILIFLLFQNLTLILKIIIETGNKGDSDWLGIQKRRQEQVKNRIEKRKEKILRKKLKENSQELENNEEYNLDMEKSGLEHFFDNENRVHRFGFYGDGEHQLDILQKGSGVGLKIQKARMANVSDIGNIDVVKEF